MDCSPPGSSVHGLSQERILEWVAISFSRGSSQSKDQTCISWIGRQILYHWTSREYFFFPLLERSICIGNMVNLIFLNSGIVFLDSQNKSLNKLFYMSSFSTLFNRNVCETYGNTKVCYLKIRGGKKYNFTYSSCSKNAETAFKCRASTMYSNHNTSFISLS